MPAMQRNGRHHCIRIELGREGKEDEEEKGITTTAIYLVHAAIGGERKKEKGDEETKATGTTRRGTHVVHRPTTQYGMSHTD